MHILAMHTVLRNSPLLCSGRLKFNMKLLLKIKWILPGRDQVEGSVSGPLMFINLVSKCSLTLVGGLTMLGFEWLRYNRSLSQILIS